MTRYDADFDRVQGLTWQPWVGQNFPERSPHQRLLVVGESHYFRGNTPELRQANRESYLDPKSTRNQVLGALVNHEWEGGNKTLDTIPQLLFDTTDIDHSRLWADSAYYNFVQRPMNYFENEKPTDTDFVAGWGVFADVVRIMQPSHCLFIGVSAANFCNLGNVTKHEKVDGVWPRVAKLELVGATSELVFVHHLARCQRVDQWHAYLQTQHPNLMSWLGAELYANSRND